MIPLELGEQVVDSKKVMVGLVGFLVVFFSFAGFMAYRETAEKKARREHSDFSQVRRQYQTELIKNAPSPQSYDGSCPPNARIVEYKSGNANLKAFLFVPKVPGKHRALLFSHGGFALGADDFAVLKPFITDNWVVMAPAVRGENGNPGNFELCLGEVSDLEAAVSYLQRLPSVDTKETFALGHSVGGTNVALLAESDSRLKRAAACGAYPMLARGGYYDEFRPFNPKHDREYEVRSFGLWSSSLKCPLLLLYGGNDPVEKAYSDQAREMQAEAKQQGKDITIDVIPGVDHFAALEPAVRAAKAYFEQ